MNHSHSRNFAARRHTRMFLSLLLLAVFGLVLGLPSPARATSSISVKLAAGNAPLTGWWPDTYWVTAGTPVAAVVTASEVNVELQKRSLLGIWVKVADKTFTDMETARLAVPLDQQVTRPVRTQMWRITVQTGNYRNALPQSFRVIGQPLAPPPDSLLTRAAGIAPNRWDRFEPCSAITWAMDVRRSPYGKFVSTQMVHEVINKLRYKTGLNFVYRGRVTHSGDVNVRSPYMLTIVWAPNSRAGAAASDHRSMRGAAFMAISKGTAVVSTVKRPRAKTKAILTHEIMHVLGAGHSKSSGDIMYPVVSSQRAFGAGDNAALKQLDAKNTCF